MENVIATQTETRKFEPCYLELEAEILVGSSKWIKSPAFGTSFLIRDIENTLWTASKL